MNISYPRKTANNHPAEGRELLEIIEDRTQRRATIVASQVPLEKWHEVLPDPSVPDAILDRLLHTARRLC